MLILIYKPASFQLSRKCIRKQSLILCGWYREFIIHFVLVSIIELEEPCVRQGGLCLRVEDCDPSNRLQMRVSLCPKQHHLGVECCYLCKYNPYIPSNRLIISPVHLDTGCNNCAKRGHDRLRYKTCSIPDELTRGGKL